jgi:L,D-peptidoglycan transpeptidase YkuD (ErfK/YbiS/YcfS/YnhG family)
MPRAMSSNAPGPRRIIYLLVAITLALAIAFFAVRALVKEWAAIPPMLATALPAECRQVILVLAPSEESVSAELWLKERRDAKSPWRNRAGPIAVTVGRAGLAWGEGEHTAPPPAGFRVKQEGDGCSPAGVFRIPYAFGYAPAPEAALSLPYIAVTETLFGVDDPKSKFYNQVIDGNDVAKDWDSAETMLRPDGLYRWGAFIAHNPKKEPGRGSCIFLHLWRGRGEGTAGCTAMAENDLKTVLTWLDPAKDPRIVQGLAAWRPR